MKRLLITTITFYQIFLSPIMKQLLGVKSMCRYTPSCSVYAKEVIKKYGMIKGIRLTVIRLLHCQPFAKSYGHI